MIKPSIGRSVHYTPDTIDGWTGERPAVIVRVWADPPSSAHEGSAVQLQVFTDGSNDHQPAGTAWKTSRTQGAGPGQYHSFEDCPAG